MEIDLQNETGQRVLEQLQRLVYIEEHQVLILPQLGNCFRSASIQDLFRLHHHETEIQLDRLRKTLRYLGVHVQGSECHVARLHSQQLMRNTLVTVAHRNADLALGCDFRLFKCHEIALYQNVCTGMKVLGGSAAISLVLHSLAEERQFDRSLESHLTVESLLRRANHVPETV
jgi:ferritin-like metal-binding protein YciE